MFITFEGCEGSGKSTAIETIKNRLLKDGYEVLLTREPGGTPISEDIRKVILSKHNTDMDPMTEALLYAASRRQHIQQKILPALSQDKIVLCDRFLDSSLAYQGKARGLGMDNIYELNHYATDGLEPDITIFFDLKPEDGLSRISKNKLREVNRLDKEKLEFHNKVYDGFMELAKNNPDRYIVIDASKSPDEVAEDAYTKILKRIEL